MNIFRTRGFSTVSLDAFVKGYEMEYTKCRECGMMVFPNEYHPYAACVLYKHTRQAEKVHDMLRDVLIYGYNSAKRGVHVDDAMRNIAASNTGLQADDAKPCSNCGEPMMYHVGGAKRGLCKNRIAAKA